MTLLLLLIITLRSIQYNVLFDELTVEEHLQFYCKLKRPEMDAKEIKEEIKTMLEKLDLVDKQKVQSSKLSGGMKRLGILTSLYALDYK